MLGAMIESQIITEVEAKMGIILACGPSVRQMYAYRRRTGTLFPSDKRQPPNSDFHAFRYRVNLRDIFWRGKDDPYRAQGYGHAMRNWPSSPSAGSHTGIGGSFSRQIKVRKDVDVGPDDSPLDELEAHVTHVVAQDADSRC